MSLGAIFLLIGLVLCFLAASGIFVIPNAVLWVLFCLLLGLLLNGVSFPPRG